MEILTGQGELAWLSAFGFCGALLEMECGVGAVKTEGPTLLSRPHLQPAYVLQIFPPCEFSESHLSRLAPDLLASISNISPHLMIVIASV